MAAWMPRSFSLRPELEELDGEERIPESGGWVERATSGLVEAALVTARFAPRGVSRNFRRGDRDGD